ncbi:winged helix-turn-helix domain-containing protein [Parvibaculum sp.]|uniref:winged helix-turn-helix domain-containing protein n=1 Tax=Parvibaculum sp. TaxID=2024848 RepID=UPI001B0C44F7|nr:winged helix-turn-helix domain-containing protein [Parvibaculum sp.]MBO6692882.1 winged helix-turn-helix domain-containing protein [Parvibaculum sp.]MBO6715240.1 winged helix-turn-helix domain-containing protein [Parvibaculum sp.]
MRQEERYWDHILAVLIARGGTAPASDVISAVAQRAGLTASSMRLTNSDGKPKYKCHIESAKQYLRHSGLVISSGRGTWSITRKGRAAFPLTGKRHATIKRSGNAYWY